MLTGSYKYSDPESDPEGISIFQWYRGNNPDGSDKEAISGAQATTYTIESDDRYKYLFFGVSPVASSGQATGEAVLSSAIGPVYSSKAM